MTALTAAWPFRGILPDCLANITWSTSRSYNTRMHTVSHARMQTRMCERAHTQTTHANVRTCTHNRANTHTRACTSTHTGQKLQPSQPASPSCLPKQPHWGSSFTLTRQTKCRVRSESAKKLKLKSSQYGIFCDSGDGNLRKHPCPFMRPQRPPFPTRSISHSSSPGRSPFLLHFRRLLKRLCFLPSPPPFKPPRTWDLNTLSQQISGWILGS